MIAFPECKNKKALGAVAGIVIDEGADRQGLFVIAQSGETVKILDDVKFKQKVCRGGQSLHHT